MRGLGWFLLANFEMVMFAHLVGADVPWPLGVAAVTFLVVGSSLLLGADRVVVQIAGMALEAKNIDLRLKALGQKADGDGR